MRERERDSMAPSILPSAHVLFQFLSRRLGGPSSSIADRSDSQLTSSSRSQAPMLTIELGGRDHQITTGGEIVNRSPLPNINARTATVPEIESGLVALPAAGSDLENRLKRVEKEGKLVCGVALSLSVSILVAVATNMKKSTRKRGELVFYKASAGFALVAFLTGIGLLVSVMVEVSGDHAHLKMWTQVVLMIFALLFVVGAVVAIAANAVV